LHGDCKEIAMRALLPALAMTWLSPAVALDLTEYRLTPSADTTIFADINGLNRSWDDHSDGQGGSLWLSTTAGGIVRRALLRFDLSVIPAGMQVVSATLTLYESRARDSHDVSLHRVLASWGEGLSNAGSQGTGDQATAGDATWRWRDYLVSEWSTRGGDFVPEASATTTVGSPLEPYTWGPTPNLVADIQHWLAHPAGNHGWIMIGAEIDAQNAKRFDSRESGVPSNRPLLVVQVAQIPEPASAALLALGVAALGAWRRPRAASAPR
jgi:hypothetical protein